MDVYFVQNFIIKIAALYLALLWNKKYEVRSLKGFSRICIAGNIGTVFEIIGLLSEIPYNVLNIVLFWVEIPLMLCLVLGRKRAYKWKLIMSVYLLTMLINGVLEVLWNNFGEYGGYTGLLMLACVIVFAGVRIWKKESQIQKGLYEIEFVHAENRVVTQGFYDSGNRLMDPYTQRGVYIISEDVRKKLRLEEEKKVFVPYQSLGNESGLIEVYYVDWICVRKEREVIEQTKCPLGVTKDNLFKDKNYEVILNEEVF